MPLFKFFSQLHQNLLSDKTKKSSEHAILIIAITSFVIHLVIIYLVDFGFIQFDNTSDLLSNPIAAIYTPFSFILLYEVYLLIYYIPKSFTTYISKQYEIMTLIVIRRLFKDLSQLTLTTDWFSEKYDLQLTYDLATSLLMFFLIYLFYLESKKRYRSDDLDIHKINAVTRFVQIKKILATVLVPVFILLAGYSFTHWLIQISGSGEQLINSFSNINNIFFEQFFTILIFADVILLLFSFFLTDEFHKVIRNSGFIISTILIRLSFSTSGLLNNALIVCAIIFGLLILFIHNKFERQLALNENEAKKQTEA